MSTATYPTDVFALVLVDVLNDFLAKDGKVNSRIQDQIEQVGFMENMTRLLSGARAAGLQIVYAPHGLHEHSFDDAKYVPLRMQAAMENHIFWKGEYGSDFYEPFRPRSGDIVASRHRTFNAFMGQTLMRSLKRVELRS